MEDVFSFADDVQTLPDKLKHLENVIIKILLQVVECTLFIQEYTGHGFSGEYTNSS